MSLPPSPHRTISLYFAPNSSAFAPLVLLEEVGADFEPIRVSLADGEQHSDTFRAVNPVGRVPVLVLSDEIVTEAVAIMDWIAHVWPEAALVPADDLERARVYEILSWITSTLHPALAQVRRPERFADTPELRQALAEPGQARFAAALKPLEQRAGESSSGYLVGSHFTLADAYALVVRRWADALGIEPAIAPRFHALTDALFGRPSVIRAITHETGESGHQARTGTGP